MTLSELHAVCLDLATLTTGAPAAVLRHAVARTAPAAAYARARHELTGEDIQRMSRAFDQLADALAATGLRLREDGLHAAAWSWSGRVEMGAG